MTEDKIKKVTIDNEKNEARFVLSGEYGYGVEEPEFEREVIKHLEKEFSHIHLVEIDEALVLVRGEIKVLSLVLRNNSVWNREDINGITKMIVEIIEESLSSIITVKVRLFDDATSKW